MWRNKNAQRGEAPTAFLCSPSPRRGRSVNSFVVRRAINAPLSYYSELLYNKFILLSYYPHISCITLHYKAKKNHQYSLQKLRQIYSVEYLLDYFSDNQYENILFLHLLLLFYMRSLYFPHIL